MGRPTGEDRIVVRRSPYLWGFVIELDSPHTNPRVLASRWTRRGADQAARVYAFLRCGCPIVWKV